MLSWSRFKNWMSVFSFAGLWASACILNDSGCSGEEKGCSGEGLPPWPTGPSPAAPLSPGPNGGGGRGGWDHLGRGWHVRALGSQSDSYQGSRWDLRFSGDHGVQGSCVGKGQRPQCGACFYFFLPRNFDTLWRHGAQGLIDSQGRKEGGREGDSLELRWWNRDLRLKALSSEGRLWLGAQLCLF